MMPTLTVVVLPPPEDDESPASESEDPHPATATKVINAAPNPSMRLRMGSSWGKGWGKRPRLSWCGSTARLICAFSRRPQSTRHTSHCQYSGQGSVHDARSAPGQY